MNKPWLIIEKVIAVLITFWGALALYSITTVILKTVHTGYSTVTGNSNFQVALIYHFNFLLALASMFAGALLFFNDKDGWSLSVICSFMYAVAFFMSSRLNAQDNKQPYFQFFKSYSLMAVLFLIILILLLQKPFRQKYKPTRKNWLIIASIIIILIIDKVLI